MDFIEAITALVMQVLTPKILYLGFYRYRVIEQTAALVSLQAVGKVKGLPDMLMLPKVHGLGGCTETLAPSTLVLVAFEGGDAGAPFVAHYLAGQVAPSVTSLVASDTFNALAGNRANIGGGNMAPAAVGTLTDTALSALWSGLNAARAGLTVPLPPILPLGSTQSAKVWITTA